METALMLHEVRDAAADAVQRLEHVKAHLNSPTPEEAQLWFLARQACDRLYYAVRRCLVSGISRPTIS